MTKKTTKASSKKQNTSTTSNQPSKTVSKGTVKPAAKKSSSGKLPKASPTKSRTRSTTKSTTESKQGQIAQRKDKLPDFLDLPQKYSSRTVSQVQIVPVPYEATTSYGKGTKNGPEAILEASREVELFDDELWLEPYKIGIHTREPVSIPPVDSETKNPFSELYQVVKELIDTDKFPIILGGEHSLSLGAVKAAASRYKDLSILQIDAHCDLRSEYQGNPYSHASVSYHIYKLLPRPVITQVGIRNISQEEAKWLETEHPNINIYWARSQERWNMHEIVNTLSEHVYLTIDVDGLDPSIMPSTGTPEPGGMGWYQLMELIKVLCVRKNVVAADIVELSPIKGLHAPDFLAAKLIYKLIGYKFALDLGVSKRYV